MEPGENTLPKRKSYLKSFLCGRYLLPCICLFAFGAVSEAYFNRVISDSDATVQETFRKNPYGEMSGQSLSVVSRLVLGDLRSFAANMFWLKTYVAWTKREYHETTLLIGFVCRLNPENVNLWIKGGDMIAMDMVGWKMDEYRAAHDDKLPELQKRAIFMEQGWLAIKHYRNALEVVSKEDSHLILMAMAEVYLNRCYDEESAIHYFKLAAWSGARVFSAFTATRLLYNTGRKEEAKAFFTEYLKYNPIGFDGGDDGEAKSMIAQMNADAEVI